MHAGLLEIVLDVPNDEDTIAAARQCWGSAFSVRVLAYRESKEQSAASMAVLVRRLVAADDAGVAFTANPLTDERSEAAVSAVKGLGERLVSGEASPESADAPPSAD
jgi:pyruvate,water dikinase